MLSGYWGVVVSDSKESNVDRLKSPIRTYRDSGGSVAILNQVQGVASFSLAMHILYIPYD